MRANAANLRWLLEKQYAGRKAMVWAHNVHVMNAFYDSNFHGVHLTQQPGDMKARGVFMAEWLGNQENPLGMTTYLGGLGLALGGPTTPVPPAPDGSLEARLHAMGHAYAFVEMRGMNSRDLDTVRLPK